uniref:Uncharacterized protein n=1 Tax=Triticum urartu TaxID=4572 RepID=A0A8R7UN07_TRIUA
MILDQPSNSNTMHQSLELMQVLYSHYQIRLRRQVFVRTCMTLPLSSLLLFSKEKTTVIRL